MTAIASHAPPLPAAAPTIESAAPGPSEPTTPTEPTAPTEPTTPTATPPDPAGEMLRHVFEVLDRDRLPYCVTHAYEQFPQHIEHDVDCIVPRRMLPRRLAELLEQNEQLIGGRIVQWFEERANFIVLQGRQRCPKTGGPVMLQLHVSSDFEVKNRVIAGGNEIIATRRSHLGRFWVPAPHVEFACILANRIDKRSLDPAHMRQLSALWSADPLKCSEQVERMFRPPSAALVGASALRNEWGPVIAALPALRREMMGRLMTAQPVGYLRRIADSALRRLKRWTRPGGGLHVVFLGPDGVGKSTVIDAVQQRIAPAFLRTDYQSFARGILAFRAKSSPHALPPRSLPASLIKACWWLVCYTAGYFTHIYPTLVRGGLMLNHRYLLDAIVDPRRYRYSGPIGLLRAIWRIAPKPDLVILLDAPADVIHARKRETTLEETTRQREGYLALAAKTRNARVVDATQTPQETIDEVMNILLDHMAAGVARRLKLK